MSVILCDRVLSSVFALPVSSYMQRRQKKTTPVLRVSQNVWIREFLDLSIWTLLQVIPITPPQPLQEAAAHLTTSLGRRANSVPVLMLPASH